ncbi:MAG: hypothetical protein WKF84_09515 [Pyrinomonadaceae bacterium]
MGIGANASIFALLNTVLLRPLPVERPDELVAVDGLGAVSYPNYKDFRDRNTVLSALAAYRFRADELRCRAAATNASGVISRREIISRCSACTAARGRVFTT